MFARQLIVSNSIRQRMVLCLPPNKQKSIISRRKSLLGLSLIATTLTATALPAPFQTSVQQRTMAYFGSNPRSNDYLVDKLISYGVVESAEVESALRKVDRGYYVDTKEEAYMDHPLPIGYAATISAPHMHASALELLKDHILTTNGDNVRVLDVGSGSGYLAACFAYMLQERKEGEGEGGGGGGEGSSRQQVEHKEEKKKNTPTTTTTTTNKKDWLVVGIDHIPELVEKSKKNVERDPASRAHLKSGHLKLIVGDGRLGWKEGGSYDAIHVGAAAPDTPHELLKQLKPGGRMVAPVGPAGGMQVLAVYDKDRDGRKIHRKNVTAVAYVPLTGKNEQLRGSWDEFEP